MATAVACWAQGFGDFTTLGRLGIHVKWLPAHAWVWWLLASLVVVAVILHLVLPVVQVSIKYRDRVSLEPKQLEPLRFFLPSSTVERRCFVALSITAGFCEELLSGVFVTLPAHVAAASWFVVGHSRRSDHLWHSSSLPEELCPAASVDSSSRQS
jgi:hypothetical protein